MLSTNGATNGHAVDEQIDTLYAFWPGMQTAPQPCPESLFSLTLKGTIGGQDAMVTVRDMTPAEFKRNIAEIRGLLDPPTPAAPPVASPGQDWCHVHNVAMKQNEKDGRRWLSHYDEASGKWCRGK